MIRRCFHNTMIALVVFLTFALPVLLVGYVGFVEWSHISDHQGIVARKAWAERGYQDYCKQNNLDPILVKGGLMGSGTYQRCGDHSGYVVENITGLCLPFRANLTIRDKRNGDVIRSWHPDCADA